MADKLKPCPFCGRAVKLIGDERAVCSNCDIVMPFAAWNRRSGEDVRTITDSIFDDPGALEDCLNRCRKLIGAKKALLDAVREVRDEGYAANALWVIKALTRIIDQHECPLNTDIPASVTKPVGTGSGTKAVTMTPDE